MNISLGMFKLFYHFLKLKGSSKEYSNKKIVFNWKKNNCSPKRTKNISYISSKTLTKTGAKTFCICSQNFYFQEFIEHIIR